MRTYRTIVSLFMRLLLVGCAACQVEAQQSGTGIEPPTGQFRIVTLTAKGQQVYVSRASAGAPARFEWVLLEPKANLFDSSGKRVGRHYKGPTWVVSGSKATGRKLRAQPAPQADTIPWLLLEVVKYEGPADGLLGKVEFIQRIDTAGGAAPSEEPAKAGIQRSAAYSATYVFWGRSKHGARSFLGR